MWMQISNSVSRAQEEQDVARGAKRRSAGQQMLVDFAADEGHPTLHHCPAFSNPSSCEKRGAVLKSLSLFFTTRVVGAVGVTSALPFQIIARALRGDVKQIAASLYLPANPRLHNVC